MCSFNYPDITFWLANFPDFAKQAIYLDSDGNLPCDGTVAKCQLPSQFPALYAAGVRYVGPQLNVLVQVANASCPVPSAPCNAKSCLCGRYAPSEYAMAAKAAGLKIITWSLERSGLLAGGGGGYYSTSNAMGGKAFTNNDGDTYELLDVLARQVGIAGTFSDWAATVTFYYNCIIAPVNNTCPYTPPPPSMAPIAPSDANHPRWTGLPVPADSLKLDTVATDSARMNDTVFRVHYDVLSLCGQRFGQNTMGRLVDKNLNPVYEFNASAPSGRGTTEAVSNTPGFTSLLQQTDGSVYALTAFETSFGAYLSQLRVDAIGGLSIVSIEPVNVSAVGGLWNPAGGSVTPWYTHLGTERAEPDGAGWAARSVEVGSFLRYFGVYSAGNGTTPAQATAAGFTPYYYGWAWEGSVVGGHAQVVKRYSMGRFSHGDAVVLADRRTVYLSDDADTGILARFLADKPGDLSSGELFCARFQQTSATGGPEGSSRFNVIWLSMGTTKDSDISAAVAGASFDMLFQTGDPANCIGAGYRLVNVGGNGPQCLKPKDGMAKLASRLETRRYAAWLGCTAELSHSVGLTYSEGRQTLFAAIWSVQGAMLDNVTAGEPTGSNDVRMKRNLCGCIMQLKVDEWYTAYDMRPLVCGMEIPVDSDNGVCHAKIIANPRDISVNDDYRQIAIAENTPNRANSLMWIYDLEFKLLTRVFSSPMSAAVGGAYFHANIGGRPTGAYNYIDGAGFSYFTDGFNYLSVATLHPSLYAGQICQIGYLRIGERIKDDVEVMGHVAITPRVNYLVNDMAPSPLKDTLQACLRDETLVLRPDPFSIAHRGAGLQFPEHTLEAYLAGMMMGAGVIECDVVVTRDGELVCSHDQCNLHTTTNILVTPLGSKCTVPFQPASGGVANATALCCTSDITLAEFKTLCVKMDGYNPAATTPADYLKGTPKFRTDLYATCGTPMSHIEHIHLMKRYGRMHTPELKAYSRRDASMPTYNQIRSKVVQQYIDAGVGPEMVMFQTFDYPDILYWLANFPEYGSRAIFLDADADDGPCSPGDSGVLCCDGTLARCHTPALFPQWVADGVRYVSPSIQMLVAVRNGAYVPSEYALAAKAAGLKIVVWTLERSGRMKDNNGGWYYFSVASITNRDGDTFEVLDVLGRQIGIEGIFSDHAATVTFYANCVLRPEYSTCFSTAASCGCDADPPKERCSVAAMRSPGSVLSVNLRRTSALTSIKFRPVDGVSSVSAGNMQLSSQSAGLGRMDGLEVSLGSDATVRGCLVTPLAASWMGPRQPDQTWPGIDPTAGLLCSGPGQYLRVRPPAAIAGSVSAHNPLFVEVCVVDPGSAPPQAVVWA